VQVFNSLESLFAAKPRIVPVEIEGVGKVFIREFTDAIGERWDFTMLDVIEKRKTDPNYRKPLLNSLIFCWSVCDEAGNLLFDVNAADFDDQVRKVAESVDGRLIDKVQEAANNLNLLTPKAKAGAEKNSVTPEPSGSGSSCPAGGESPSTSSDASSLTASSNDN
jgi:hypothetical protein